MNQTKADLVLHPVRLKILQILTRDSLSTQEISERMPDVPASSIYRHLRVLLKGGMIEVVDTRQVKGTQEKIYRLIQTPHLNQQDLAGASDEDHLKYFTSYAASLIQDFADYLSMSSDRDLLEDRMGYSEFTFYASQEELDLAFARINQELLRLAKNSTQEGKQLRKLAIISHPIGKKETRDDA